MNYAGLVKAINSATTQLQGRVAAAGNQALVIRNWVVGAYLIEFEQTGKDRAKYGTRLLEKLAADLAGKQIKGLEIRNLRNCRLLYLRFPQIRQALAAELALPSRIPLAVLALPVPPLDSSALVERADLGNSADTACRIPGTRTPELPTPLSSGVLLRLSWSKLVELIALDDPWKRAFYENECLKGNWSVRQLQRQIGSLLFERTGLSTNKKALIERARKQEPHRREPPCAEPAGGPGIHAHRRGHPAFPQPRCRPHRTHARRAGQFLRIRPRPCSLQKTLPPLLGNRSRRHRLAHPRLPGNVGLGRSRGRQIRAQFA